MRLRLLFPGAFFLFITVTLLDEFIELVPIHFKRLLRIGGIPFNGAFGNRDGAEFFIILENLHEYIGLADLTGGKGEVDVMDWHICRRLSFNLRNRAVSAQPKLYPSIPLNKPTLHRWQFAGIKT